MKALLREATLAVGVLALLSGIVLADPKPGKKKPDDAQKKVIIQLDASKLSPELLAQLLKAAGQGDVKPGVKKPVAGAPDGGKPGTKPAPDQPKPDVKKPVGGEPEVKKPAGDGKVKTLTLALAIGYAEKYAQGIAYKAEYEGNGFVVLVKNDKGTTKVKMDALGNIAGEKNAKPGEEKKPSKTK